MVNVWLVFCIGLDRKKCKLNEWDDDGLVGWDVEECLCVYIWMKYSEMDDDKLGECDGTQDTNYFCKGSMYTWDNGKLGNGLVILVFRKNW